MYTILYPKINEREGLSMGWLKKVVKEEPEEVPQIPEGMPHFIDLAEYSKKGVAGRSRGMQIKVAEIDSYEDIRDLTNYVYEGNILILDFSAIINDDLSLKRIITELKRLVEDIDGDMAGINKNLLVVTPKKVSIDRNKVRRGGRRR
jgi:SepF-like predicted cell division protein (DUF552 family)